jgi:hypothetical protein
MLTTITELVDSFKAKGVLGVSYNLESSSGLLIPLVTITNPEDTNTNKKIILMTARQHPGETQGSWMMHRLLKFLCSEEAKLLRSLIIFKILPMVNVDGVVLGNFRTGVLGLDLNRLYQEEECEDVYEVDHIKGLASIKNTIMYLDFHGHSTKKNVFIYGTEYILSRLLPKQISRLSHMFRYYSCSFKISKGKEKTARASLLREFRIPYCYTIEASTHSYTSSEGEFLFNSSLYSEMGNKIGASLCIVVPILVGIHRKKMIIKEQLLKNK